MGATTSRGGIGDICVPEDFPEGGPHHFQVDELTPARQQGELVGPRLLFGGGGYAGTLKTSVGGGAPAASHQQPPGAQGHPHAAQLAALASAKGVRPVVLPSNMPQVEPGKPLDPLERQDLLILQQQIKHHLQQQRELVTSLRRVMTQDGHAASSSCQGLGSTDVCKLLAVASGDEPIDNTEDLLPTSAVLTPKREDSRQSDDQSQCSSGNRGKKDAEQQAQGPARLLSPPVGWDNLPKTDGVEPTDHAKNSTPDEKATDDFQEEPPPSEHPPDLTTSKPPAGGSEERAPLFSQHFQSNTTTTTSAALVPAGGAMPPLGPSRDAQRDNSGMSSHPRRPMPSPAPQTLRQTPTMVPTSQAIALADWSTIGTVPPAREERRWIEVAVRRMFRSLGPGTLANITEAFREWHLPPMVAVLAQGSPITSGPGLCVLFDGVVDVLYREKGAVESEKVCTYDRRGQCFGELELFYDAPRVSGCRRKSHWATTASRTPAVLWVVDRLVLRNAVPGAENTRGRR